MLSGKTKKKAAPESYDSCPRLRELKEEKVPLAHLISKAREGFEERLNGNDLKLTLADYLRTVQARLAQRYPGGSAVWLNTPSLRTNSGRSVAHSGSKSIWTWRI